MTCSRSLISYRLTGTSNSYYIHVTKNLVIWFDVKKLDLDQIHDLKVDFNSPTACDIKIYMSIIEP